MRRFPYVAVMAVYARSGLGLLIPNWVPNAIFIYESFPQIRGPVISTDRKWYGFLQASAKVMPMSCLWCFPQAKRKETKVMPKSCLWCFPQGDAYAIGSKYVVLNDLFRAAVWGLQVQYK